MKLKSITFLAYLFVVIGAGLCWASEHFNFFENKNDIKYFFPIIAIGCFLMSYSDKVNGEKFFDEYHFFPISYQKRFISILIGVLLIFFMFFM